MKIATNEMENKVDELLAVLEKDIQHIQQCLSNLNKLRSLVIKRDDTTLSKLLEDIQSESNSYKNNELKRQSLRKELAKLICCDFKQMTLSRLEAIVPEGQKSQVISRKTKLRESTEELKKEHLSTVLLLSECARFNNLLLKNIFNLSQVETITYNSDGMAKRQNDAAFVNLRF